MGRNKVWTPDKGSPPAGTPDSSREVPGEGRIVDLIFLGVIVLFQHAGGRKTGKIVGELR
jgi:hypothetical protein